MTQLILDLDDVNLELPESINDGYTVTREPLYVDVEMYSGRLTRELRGFVWRVSYQHGYFNERDKNALIEACEKGIREPIRCAFLIQETQTMPERMFLITKFTRPRFMWGRNDEPIWADFSLEMREVSPSD